MRNSIIHACIVFGCVAATFCLGRVSALKDIEAVAAEMEIEVEPVKPDVKEVKDDMKVPESFKTFMFTLQVVLSTPESSKAARERLCKLSGVLKSIKDIENAAPVALYGVFKDGEEVKSVELDL